MSLIAHYPLHGDSKDYSGNGKDLINDGALLSNEGKIGKSYDFKNRKAMKGDNLIKSDTFSISAWIKYEDGSNQCLLCSRTVLGEGVSIFKLGNSFRFDAGGQWQITYNVPQNEWIHVIFIKDNNIKKCYVNGTLIEYIDTATSLENINTTMTIGASQVSMQGYDNFIYGKVNDIKIYDHALSTKEINDVYKTKILHYNFNQMVEPTINLIEDPYYERNDFWTTNNSDVAFIRYEYIDGKKCLRLTRNKGKSGFVGLRGKRIQSKPSTKYTLSFKYMIKESFDQNLRVYFPENRSNNTLADYRHYINIRNADKPGEWISVSTTWETVSDSAYYPNGISMDWHEVASNKEENIWVTDIQLEEKPYPTECTKGERSNNIIIDISGYKNNSIVNKTNPPRWINDSILGTGAYEFNGTQSMICDKSVLPVEGMQEWTVCAWVKYSGTPNTGQYLTNMNSGVKLHHSDGRALTYINSGVNDWYRYSSPITETGWFHFATTFNQKSDRIKLWINGVDCTAYGPNGGGTKIPEGIKNNLILFESFKGKSSDVRIYATELKEQDILNLYNSKASISKDGKFYVNEIKEESSYCSYANGINLVRNGAGEYNDTTNFGNSITLVTTDGVSNGKCFERIGNYQFSTTEPIEVNTSDLYEVSGMFKSTGVAGTSKLYYGVQCLDENKSLISFTSCHYYENTKTTLARDLNKGDTVVYLQSAANWVSTNQGSTSSQKNVGIFDKKGFPDYVCAKTTLPYVSVDSTNNTVTLETPWPYSTVKTGTKVANNWAGSGYNYCATDGQAVVPAEWTRFKGNITGELPNSGERVFRPGTKYVKLLLLMNYGQSNDYSTRFTDCYIKNLSRYQANQEVTGFNVSKKSIASTKCLNEIQPMDGLIFQADLEKDNYVERISGQKIITSENFTRFITTPFGKTVPYFENIPGADPNAQYMGISRNIPALKSSADQYDYTMSIAFYTEKKDQMTESIMFGKAGNHHGIMTHGASVGFRRIETNYITNQSVTRFYTKPLTDDLLNRWNVFTVTYNRGTYKCYLNGGMVDQRDVTTPMETTWINSDTWLFSGNSKDWVSYKFVGALTDARVYNRALTDKEVKQNYDAFISPIFSIEKDGSIISKEFIEV